MNLNFFTDSQIPITSLDELGELPIDTSIYCDHGHIFYGDYRDFLSEVQTASVDMAFTDCPYWTLNKWRNVGTTTRLGGGSKVENHDETKFFDTIDQTELWELICEFGRVLKKNSHLWMMCDGQTLGYILGYANEGETPFNYVKPYPVLKRAKTGGYRAGMGYHGRGAHEFVVLLEKGRRKFNDENWPDVFEPLWDGDSYSKTLTPDGAPYPTAKPTSLLARILELSSKKDDVVIDPFSGSGSFAEAAAQMGCYFKVCDKSPRAIYTTINAVDSLFKASPQISMFEVGP